MKSLEQLKEDAYLEWLYPTYLFVNRDQVIENGAYKRRLDYDAGCAMWDAAIKALANQKIEPIVKPDFDSKNIYLKKDNMIVGLHAIGIDGPYTYTMDNNGIKSEITTDFETLESWGNEYDENHNMLGRGSFRLNVINIEDYAKDLVLDGWVIYEGPKRV